MYFSFHNLLKTSSLVLEDVKRRKLLPSALEIGSGRRPRLQTTGAVSRGVREQRPTAQLVGWEQEARRGGVGNRGLSSELPSVRNRQVDTARGTRNRVVTRDPRKEVISLLAWLGDVFFVCADNGWLQCPGNQRKKLPDATCPGLFQKWKAQPSGMCYRLSQPDQTTYFIFFNFRRLFNIC